MHALTLARKRIRARIQNSSTPTTVRLAHGMVEDGRARFLPVLSSALAQSILSNGYDARTLDRVYGNHASSEMGLVGKIADRVVQNLPVHQGLRERLEATVGEISAAAVMATRAGEPEFRALFAPCGLASEMVGVGRRLQSQRPEAFERLRCWGVDLDPEGHLLPEAKRRALDAGLHAKFIREDLRRHHEVRAVAARHGLFHLISCVGIPQRFSEKEVAELVQFYTRLLAPGGVLLIDRWQPASSSKVASGLQIQMRTASAPEFRAMLDKAGLVVDREHPSGEGGCVLVVARKPLPKEQVA